MTLAAPAPASVSGAAVAAVAAGASFVPPATASIASKYAEEPTLCACAVSSTAPTINSPDEFNRLYRDFTGGEVSVLLLLLVLAGRGIDTSFSSSSSEQEESAKLALLLLAREVVLARLALMWARALPLLVKAADAEGKQQTVIS